MRVVWMIVVVVIGLGCILGFQYWRYATNTQSPYDEVGIMLNGWMPGPVKDWGCGRLQENFGASLPPMGCEAAGDPTAWR